MRRAFSLIELLVAVALIGAIASAMTFFTWRLIERRDRLTAMVQRQQGLAVLLGHIEADLLTCVAAEGAAPGVSGTGESLRLLSRGVGLVAGPGGPDLSDLQGTEYRFSGGRVTGRRWAGASASASLGEDEIVAGVGRIRFRYFDRGAWRASFDAAKEGRLPAAIEVAVWYDAPPSEHDPEPSRPDEAGSAGEPQAAPVEEDDPVGPAPDRVRIIIVPDGPDAWGGS